jgi:hypothetical protein
MKWEHIGSGKSLISELWDRVYAFDCIDTEEDSFVVRYAAYLGDSGLQWLGDFDSQAEAMAAIEKRRSTAT